MDFDLQFSEGQKPLVLEKHRRKTVLFFCANYWAGSQGGGIKRWKNRAYSGKLGAQFNPVL
jgi:hypothetical protein